MALEDGTSFRGASFGAEGETFGEAVFNTGMAGYQEILTDPSYTGQIVAMTSPHQGNDGTNDADPESERLRVAGFAVREAARRASSWRAETSLRDALATDGVVGIEGIDTRRLTLCLRQEGAMRGAISTVDLQPASLAERAARSAPMAGAELASSVTVVGRYEADDVVGAASTDLGQVYRVAAVDFGMKRNILRRLAAAGVRTTVFPARTPAAELLEGGWDGVFLSNGPGDPAATGYAVDAIRELIGKIPIFGICLGHQLLGLALGGRTYKMKFGHRGVNQPVRNRRSGVVEITSHNHGFAVDPDAWTKEADGSVRTDAGRLELTHWNLNDGTLEGMRCLDVPAFSVQYHPEAAPGPHDSRYLFDEFRDLMRGATAGSA
jgi:carbamoyl-phosphate synthase small subunit